MRVLNFVLGKAFDVLFLPFRGLNPWLGMVFISFLTGLLMLFVFSRTSNQTGIRAVKDRIKAHLLEIRLYKDSLPVQIKAQGRIILANLRYLSYSLRPMLILIIPLLLILAQLNLWFGSRSLRPGEAALIKIYLEKGQNPMDLAIRLDPPPGLEVETEALRLEDDAEIDWRIRAAGVGLYQLSFRLDGGEFTKTVAVGLSPLSRVSGLKVSRGLLAEILNPGENPLPSGLPVKRVEVVYPGLKLTALGIGFHWLVAYFLLSIIFGFALKRPLKVEV